MITKKDLTEFNEIVKNHTQPKISNKMISLQKELDDLGGFSKEKRFYPLIGSLAWGYDLVGTIYVTSKSKKNINQIVTVLFFISILDEETGKDAQNDKESNPLDNINNFNNLKNFISKWLINKESEKVSTDEIRQAFYNHAFQFSIKSVPYGLKNEFFDNLQKASIKSTQTSIEYAIKVCPFCKTEVKVQKEEKFFNCENCGGQFI